MRFIGTTIALVLLVVTVCGCGNNKNSGYISPDSADIDNTVTSSADNGTTDSSFNNSTSSSLSSDALDGDNVSNSPSLPSVQNPNVFGNTTGNLHNGGMAAIEEDWIYYSTATGLYRIHVDSDNPERIFDQQVTDINVSNGFIYCNKHGSLIKMRADGTSVTTLANNVVDLVLYGNFLYFTEKESLYLKRVQVDGSKKLLLLPEYITNLCITEDRIYWGKDRHLSHADINGQNLNDYFNVPTDDMLIYKGYKYSSGALIKERIDGTDSSTLVPSGVSKINVADDWIYYIDINNEHTPICKIKTDGTGFKQLPAKNCMSFNVVGKWIYYTAHGDSSNDAKVTEYYRISIDGNDIQKIN